MTKTYDLIVATKNDVVLWNQLSNILNQVREAKLYLYLVVLRFLTVFYV